MGTTVETNPDPRRITMTLKFNDLQGKSIFFLESLIQEVIEHHTEFRDADAHITEIDFPIIEARKERDKL